MASEISATAPIFVPPCLTYGLFVYPVQNYAMACNRVFKVLQAFADQVYIHYSRGITMFPKARTEELSVVEFGDELLVFDHRSQRAHCLNRVAQAVWNLCDGRVGRTEISASVRRDTGAEHPEALVDLAFDQLSSRGLLETPIAKAPASKACTRRHLLQQMVASAVLLPAIMSITAPSALAAASKAKCNNNGDCASLNGPCTDGVCMAGNCVPQNKPNGTPCGGLDSGDGGGGGLDSGDGGGGGLDSGGVATCNNGVCI